MKEKILKSLFDIKAVIAEIEAFTHGFDQDFDRYNGNFLVKRAVERDLEIIGEAVGRILKENPEFELENARRIVGLRNQIIYAYDNISDRTIWSVVIKHIPLLREQVLDMLKDAGYEE